MLHLDASSLTFKVQPDGSKRAEIDVVAIAFGADGKLVEQMAHTYEVRARGEFLDKIMRHGLVYNLVLPVKKSGGYQLRVAVRDAATERTGSANQFIEVPNLGNERLALSGIVVSSSTATAAQPAAYDTDDETTTGEQPQASPAVRRFRPGTTLEYGFMIYNAKLDPAMKRPRLTVQARLFRDGKEVFATAPQILNAAGQQRERRLLANGRLDLGAGFPSGEYVLQVVVTDAVAKSNRNMATQWSDFEVVK